MRRRHEKSGPAAGNRSPTSTEWASRVFSRFDVYARVDDDLAVKTEAGAAVTIGFWLLMVILCIGEIQAYRKLRPPEERVVVDPSLGQRLRISVDIVRALLLTPNDSSYCFMFANARHINHHLRLFLSQYQHWYTW